MLLLGNELVCYFGWCQSRESPALFKEPTNSDPVLYAESCRQLQHSERSPLHDDDLLSLLGKSSFSMTVRKMKNVGLASFENLMIEGVNLWI